VASYEYARIFDVPKAVEFLAKLIECLFLISDVSVWT
jgi:hypothetical protein